jgi:prepilin-type N-terminal cleavage/methylation domain-containing protein
MTGGRARKGFTLAEVIVSAVILAIAAAVVLPYLADQNRRRNAEDTRDMLYSLSLSLNNAHYCAATVAGLCPTAPAITQTVGYEGYVQKVLKYPQRLHQLTTKINTTTERSCSGALYVGGDTLLWNPIGAAPSAIPGTFAPYSSLPIVSGKGVYSAMGWIHDSVLKSTTGTPSIAGFVEVHIDSLSLDDVQELDEQVDGVGSTGTTGLLRYAANGSYQLARFLISAPVNGATTKGC